ncbi:unnamed protein product [Microthlaspi erraticum]|uniref:Uncharacterized protein n=1 Tax=Microthlaspi erraticum TaxID=1685480 RepID=A0A6D2HTB0_9BRAS|nr:unnamed protein product [Microthlaspi erraticum]
MVNSKENTPTGSPSRSEENLSDDLPPPTVDKSLPAEDMDKSVPSPRKDESPPLSAPRRSRKPSSSDKHRSSKKSSSSDKLRKLMENLVKPLAEGFEAMRAQQNKTQEQVEALAREDEEPLDPAAATTNGTTTRPSRHQLGPELMKALADTRRSPLTRRLRQIDLHERVRLKIDSYTGEEDPKKWLTAFNLTMTRETYKSYDEKEANYCQVFVGHMAKDALPSRSTTSTT